MRELRDPVREQTLVVKTEDSAYFAEARFTLRRDAPAGESEMVKEANRILVFYGKEKTRAQVFSRRPPTAFFYFLSGICCGLVFTAAATAILSFFR